jgi:hypothetical protein
VGRFFFALIRTGTGAGLCKPPVRRTMAARASLDESLPEIPAADTDASEGAKNDPAHQGGSLSRSPLMALPGLME